MPIADREPRPIYSPRMIRSKAEPTPARLEALLAALAREAAAIRARKALPPDARKAALRALWARPARPAKAG